MSVIRYQGIDVEFDEPVDVTAIPREIYEMASYIYGWCAQREWSGQLSDENWSLFWQAMQEKAKELGVDLKQDGSISMVVH